jgi:hypothetical protein
VSHGGGATKTMSPTHATSMSTPDTVRASEKGLRVMALLAPASCDMFVGKLWRAGSIQCHDTNTHACCTTVHMEASGWALGISFTSST